jgi:hypothetical protein
VKFDWDFGDGTYAKGDQFPEHAFSKAGTYSVRLTVTDDEGAVAVASQTVVITSSNRPPEPRLAPVDANRFMQFGLVEMSAASSTDPDGEGEIAKYTWSFKGPNGYSNHDSRLLTIGSRYLFQAWHAGDYSVKLMVTDKWGATSTTTMNINVPPWDGTYRVNAISSSARPGNKWVNFDTDSEIAKGWTTMHSGLGSEGPENLMGETPDKKPVSLRAKASHLDVRNNSLPLNVPDDLKGVFSSAVGGVYSGYLGEIDNLPPGTYTLTAYLYDADHSAPGTKYTVRFGETRLDLTVPEKATYKDFIATGTLIHKGGAKTNILQIVGDTDDTTPESSPLAGFTLKLVGQAPTIPAGSAPRNLKVVSGP